MTCATDRRDKYLLIHYGAGSGVLRQPPSIGSCPGLNFKKTQLCTHGIISGRVLCLEYKWRHTCIFRMLAFNTLTLRGLPILAGESVNWYTCIIAVCGAYLCCDSDEILRKDRPRVQISAVLNGKKLSNYSFLF